MSQPHAKAERAFLENVHHWFANKLDDNKPGGSIASLDGVRALAFLIVLSFHVSFMISKFKLWHIEDKPFLNAIIFSGGSGVTLFLVLSGFLLFLPYSQALLLNKSWPQTKLFYLRRILRIFPLYYFSLFILVMFHNPYLLAPQNWIKLLPFLTFTMSFSNSQPIDGPYWTLAVEFQYYLLLPVIALAIYSLTRLVRSKKRLLVVICSLCAMIIWGIATRCWGDYFTSHPQETFLLSRSNLNIILAIVYGENGKFLEDFAIGMLIATCFTFVNNSPRKEHYLRLLQRLSPWLAILCLPLYAFIAMRYYAVGSYVWPIAPDLFHTFPWANEIGYALAYGCGVMAVLFNRPGGLLKRLFSWTALRWIGLISFGLYIWHVPFMLILEANVGPSLVQVNHYLAICLCWLLVFGFTISFSFVTYVLIEKRGLHLSNQLRKQMLTQQAPIQTIADIPNPSQQAMDQAQNIQTQARLQPDPVSPVRNDSVHTSPL